MRLVNERMFPPGGWQFTNPETGWNAPDPRSNDLGTQVRNIIQHRRANRPDQPTDPAVVKAELVEFTCQRLMNQLPASQWKSWIAAGEDPNLKKNLRPTPSKKPQSTPPRNLLARLAERLVGLPNGLKTIAEWVGEGCTPVDQELAEKRANTCATCEENMDSGFFDLLTGPIAEAIKRHSEAKAHLKLGTLNDNHLGVCDVCGCHLKTKVWVPIRNLHRSEWLRKPPGHCWMVTEEQ